MSFTLKWNNTDITKKVANYKRDSSICSGTKTISVLLTEQGNYDTWDELELWENGNKIGKFFIKEATDKENGSVSISAQDSSLRLENYFIEEVWDLDYISNAKYWIEKWLNDAGVSYNFKDSGNGAVLNKNSSFGRETAYSLILPMLQKSGWYIMFDENDVAQIGSLDVDTKSVSATYDETDIINIEYSKGDKRSRNRVVAWGGKDPASDSWITAERTVDTPWQIDSDDVRSILISDGNIRNYATAYGIVNQLLDKFSPATKEKTVTLHGFRNINVGDLVYVESRVFTGTGLVTDINVQSSSEKGYITTLELDRRCPRIFGFIVFDGYVYVGTNGGGIYRKPFETTTFSSFNSGLDNLVIKDLYIDNGILTTIDGDGYAYYSTSALSSWVKINHGEFEDHNGNTYNESQIKATSCSIDEEGTIIIGYNHSSENLSWIVHYEVYQGITRKKQLTVASDDTIKISDLDNTGEMTIISSEGTGGVIVGEGLITRNPDAGLLNKDSPGYIINSNYISSGSYTTKNISYITAYHNEFCYQELAVGSDIQMNKVNISGNTVESSVVLPSVFGTNARPLVHVLDEDTLILNNANKEPNGDTYLYSVDFNQGSSSKYEKLEKRTDYFMVTSAGATFRVYNTTDPEDFSASGGWNDGLNPLNWYVSINGGAGQQILTNSDFSLEATGSLQEYHKDQYFPGMEESPNGNLVLPVIEVLGVQDYEQDAYGTDNHKNIIWGKILFKTIVITPSGGIDIYDGYSFETKHDETCDNQYNVDGNFVRQNLYSWSEDVIQKTLPDHTRTDSALLVFSMPVFKDGCKNAIGSDFEDTTTYWRDYFSDSSIAEKESPIYYNYVIRCSTSHSTLFSEEEVTSGFSDNDDYGHSLQGTWSRNYNTGQVTSLTGNHPEPTIDPIYSVESKSCDKTGKIIARHNISPYEIKLFSENSSETIFNSNSSETSFQLIGNHLATEERLLYADVTSETQEVVETGDPARIIKDDYNNSTEFVVLLDSLSGTPRVEISRSVPTVIYERDSTSFLYTSLTNKSGSFTQLPTGKKRAIADLRVYNSGNTNTLTGGLDIITTGDFEVYAIDSGLSGDWVRMFSGTTVSGNLHRLETTNGGIDPYFFISTSGSPSKFYQKNEGLSNFNEYSNGLPSNNITIIRTDDII